MDPFSFRERVGVRGPSALRLGTRRHLRWLRNCDHGPHEDARSPREESCDGGKTAGGFTDFPRSSWEKARDGILGQIIERKVAILRANQQCDIGLNPAWGQQCQGEAKPVPIAEFS